MKCLKCGMENPERSIYCCACGALLSDGHAPEESGSYGNENEFADVVKEQPAVCSAEVQPASPDIMHRIVGLGGNIAAFIGVLCALVFTFLIGVTASVSGSTNDLDGMLGNSVDIYYYFGEAYQDIGASLDSLPKYEGEYSLAMYLPAVFGTLISAATILAVLIFSVLAIKNYIGYVIGKRDKAVNTSAYCAMFSYIIGAFAFAALHSSQISGDSVSYNSVVYINAGTTLNSFTVAGIILCAVFAAIAVAFRLAQCGRQLSERKNLAKFSFLLMGTALNVVIIGLCASVGPHIRILEDGGSSKINLFLGDMMSLSAGASFDFIMQQMSQKTEYSLLAHDIFAALAQAAMLFVLVLALINLVSNIGKINNEKKIGIVMPIVLAVGGLILMVMSLLSGTQFMRIFQDIDTDTIVSCRNIPAVILFALTFLNAVLAVVGRLVIINANKVVNNQEES